MRMYIVMRHDTSKTHKPDEVVGAYELEGDAEYAFADLDSEAGYWDYYYMVEANTDD